jgi:AcrR family transcriptional regulator
MAMAVKKIQPLTPRQRRETAKQNLRGEILAASREIIAKDGYAALTMRKLAERIGYSPAALYLHFRSREEIAQEVSRDGYAALLAELTAATEPHRKDAAARLRASARAYVEFGLKNPQTYALIFMEDPAYLSAAYAKHSEDDPATRAFELLVEIAGGLIAAGLKPPKTGKPTRAVTPVELAETLWATLHGVVSLKLTCPAFPTSPAETLTHVAMETLLLGLGAAGAKKMR